MKPPYAYEGRAAQSFCFTMDESVHDVATALALLGVSKTVSARLRAQGRAVLDPKTHGLAITAAVEAPSAHIRAQVPLRVLYEDDFALAVDKPSGLLVHGDGSGADTLTGRVEDYLAAGEGLLSPQAVQRLDAETTGVVLFSKTAEFQGLFDAIVADHALMQKRYLALVEGAYPKTHDRIDAPLARDRHDARRMRTCSHGQGQDALTYVERLATTPDGRFSLLLLTLGTGRKHQIRVHLASRGFPVVGDALYGHNATTLNSKGGHRCNPGDIRFAAASDSSCPIPLMLHAWRGSFTHPITGESLVVTSPSYGRFEPYVPDIAQLLENL